jgi:hypothetical protein
MVSNTLGIRHYSLERRLEKTKGRKQDAIKGQWPKGLLILPLKAKTSEGKIYGHTGPQGS